MSNNIFIREIYSLQNLYKSVSTFSNKGLQDELIINLKIKKRFDYIDKLENKIKFKINEAVNKKNIAENELRICLSSGIEDDEGNYIVPDCRSEKEYFEDCIKEIQQLENDHYEYKREISSLQSLITELARSSYKFKNICEILKINATNSLNQLINGAQDYVNLNYNYDIPSVSKDINVPDIKSSEDLSPEKDANSPDRYRYVLEENELVDSDGNKTCFINRRNNNTYTSSILIDGEEHIASRLKVNGSKAAIMQIASTNKPINKNINVNIIKNMEQIGRSANCNQITYWSSKENKAFFKQLEYEHKNSPTDTSGEVSKNIFTDFFKLQNKAKNIFKNKKPSDFIGGENIGFSYVDSLHILSPNKSLNDKIFWSQHAENINRYIDLIKNYNKCKKKLEDGISLNVIRSEFNNLANAYDVFHGSEPVKLLKTGQFYKVDAGYHRVLAAHLYHLKTGEKPLIWAEVFEKNHV